MSFANSTVSLIVSGEQLLSRVMLEAVVQSYIVLTRWNIERLNLESVEVSTFCATLLAGNDLLLLAIHQINEKAPVGVCETAPE